MHTAVSVLSTRRALAFWSAGTAATALVIALPTAVLPSPFFTRMTPVRPLDYVLLTLTALGMGLLAATYAGPTVPALGERRTVASGLLAFLAIGCPICNKIVVLLLGVSGALTYFEPLQPLLGASGVLLLVTAVVVRVRGLERCAVVRPV